MDDYLKHHLRDTLQQATEARDMLLNVYPETIARHFIDVALRRVIRNLEELLK